MKKKSSKNHTVKTEKAKKTKVLTTKSGEKIFDTKIGFWAIVKTSLRAFFFTLKLEPRLTINLSIAILVVSMIPILQNNFLGEIVNNLTTGLSNGAGAGSDLYKYILLYVLGWILIEIVSNIWSYLERTWYIKVEHKITVFRMRNAATFDIAQYEDPKFQNLINRSFDNGMWPIMSLSRGQIQNTVDIFKIIATGSIIYSISPLMFFVTLISSVPKFVVELMYGQKVWGIWAENSERQRLYYSLRHHITGRSNVVQTKTLQVARKILIKMEAIMSAFTNDQVGADRKRFWLILLTSLISGIGFGYSLYALIGQVVSGNILVGTVIFALTSLQIQMTTISTFLSNLAEQYKHALNSNDMFRVFDTKPLLQDTGNTKLLDTTKTPTITFENVGFKYPADTNENGQNDENNESEAQTDTDITTDAISKKESDKWVLRNLNFTINPGEKIGLVGQNGAGKSTLTKLLMRVYDPTEGRILVNGVDLRDISLNQWISTMSILMQQYSMHELAIEESIAMGLPDKDIDKSRVLRSAMLSGANDFIQKYAKGYEQQVGRDFEEGIEPSQGQLQKLALARSLYRMDQAQILILDEPTAAIDPLAELEIFDKLEQSIHQKTLILITHRFNSVKNVDRILVIANGTVAEIGNHKELMEKKGIYANIFENQAKGFVEGLDS